MQVKFEKESSVFGITKGFNGRFEMFLQWFRPKFCEQLVRGLHCCACFLSSEILTPTDVWGHGKSRIRNMLIQNSLSTVMFDTKNIGETFGKRIFFVKFLNFLTKFLYFCLLFMILDSQLL